MTTSCTAGCAGTNTDTSSSTAAKVRDAVKRQYGSYVEGGGEGPSVLSDRGENLGYARDYLASIGFQPTALDSFFTASCGTGCPNRLPGGPTTGETVIDMGCGAGHDVLIASCLVGSKGKVIGIDLTPEMIAASQKNMNIFGASACENSSFVCSVFDDAESEIDANSADVVMSNGAFNLCVDKKPAFASAFRMLRPGGRFLLSDVCKVEPNLSAYVVDCTVGDEWTN